MSTVTSLNEFYAALKNDEKEITIKDPALSEYKVISASDVNALKNLWGGIGVGTLMGVGSVAVGALVPVVGLIGLVAAIGKLGKTLTVDNYRAIKDDKELVAAQKQIVAKYPSVDMKNMANLIAKWYTISSSGNSYITLKHK